MKRGFDQHRHLLDLLAGAGNRGGGYHYEGIRVWQGKWSSLERAQVIVCSLRNVPMSLPDTKEWEIWVQQKSFEQVFCDGVNSFLYAPGASCRSSIKLMDRG